MNIKFSKKVLPYAAAIIIAIVITFYFAHAEKFWIVLSTLLIMQAPINVSLRQGIERFFIIAASVFVGTLLALFLQKQVFLITLILIFGAITYIFLGIKENYKFFNLNVLNIIGIIGLIALLLPANNTEILYARLYDISIGTVIGILSSLLIFPPHLDTEFRKELIPILKIYIHKLSEVVDVLFKKTNDVLPVCVIHFPDWVYQTGLDATLRAGHRHFLIMVERLGQILTSMHYVASHQFDNELLQELNGPLTAYVTAVNEVIMAIISVLDMQPLKEGVSDLREELAEIEKVVSRFSPPLELIDISSEYLYLAAFMENLKDFREVLLRLAVALRK